MNKKYLKYAAIAFCVWFLITSPQQAAGLVSQALSGLGDAAQSVTAFMGALNT